MANLDNILTVHEKLNPVLWKGEHLRPEVKRKLMEISKEFYGFLDISAPVKDIMIVGSQANFTYSVYSDIDLHFIFDFTQIKCDEPIEELFDAKRKLWKEQHDIKIYNIPVELYVEEHDKPSVSSAYSILTDQWVRHPKTPKIYYNTDEVKNIVEVWDRILRTVIASKNYEICKHAFDLLRKYRKLGLKEQGEFGPANLAYKSLRNSGIITELLYLIRHLQDQELSLK